MSSNPIGSGPDSASDSESDPTNERTDELTEKSLTASYQETAVDAGARIEDSIADGGQKVPHYQDSSVTLHHGDCLDVLATLPDASVDAVVTDPPYGLEFMGKDWDRFARQDTTAQRGNAGGFGDEEGKPWNKARSGTKGVRSTFKCRKCGGWSGSFSEARRARQRPCECETPDYDYAGAPAQTLAFGAWCEQWTAECLRVLKPGGHLLAFGGTRTWHRLACAVEDAGFEVRDSIAWLYGSGFPKSLDVSKAIDKAAGAERTEVLGRRWEENRKPGTKASGILGEIGPDDGLITAPATPDAARWHGWGTALKPAFEPVVVARKPLAGTVAGNVLAHGTGALNIDACRMGFTSDADKASARPGGKTTSLNGALAGKAQTCETSSTTAPTTDSSTTSETGNAPSAPTSSTPRTEFRTEQGAGRWPANVVLDSHQAAALDQQSGERPSSGGAAFETGGYGGTVGLNRDDRREIGFGDTGGASRFFYVAKAPTTERVKVDGIAHPTVKPLALMRWLVRLVTPPGGTVLEPFAGSGTTVEACILEGFQVVAIEREADYLPLITQRIHRRKNPVEAVRGSLTQEDDDMGLFDLLDEGPAA